MKVIILLALTLLHCFVESQGTRLGARRVARAEDDDQGKKRNLKYKIKKDNTKKLLNNTNLDKFTDSLSSEGSPKEYDSVTMKTSSFLDSNQVQAFSASSTQSFGVVIVEGDNGKMIPHISSDILDSTNPKPPASAPASNPVVPLSFPALLPVLAPSSKMNPILSKPAPTDPAVLKPFFINPAVPTQAPIIPPKQPPTLSYRMVFSSDPQFSWDGKKFPQDLSGGDKDNNAERQIRQQYYSMISLENVKGVIINGDLTDFGSQNGHLSSINRFISEELGQNNVDVFQSLGNHDYWNNIDDCIRESNGLLNQNYCASQMVKHMVDRLNNPSQKHATNYDFDNFPTDKASAVFFGSMAYSFNIDKVHYVILQQHVGYTHYWNNPGQIGGYFHYVIRDSWDWLDYDLASARNRGDSILVFTHAYQDKDKGWDNEVEITKFNGMLCKYGVSALFGGHIHEHIGYRYEVGDCHIPFFRTGSASHQHYLVADIDIPSKSMSVSVRNDSVSNNPTNWDKTKHSYNNFFDKSVSLNDSVGSHPIPPRNKKGFVMFWNQSFYLVRVNIRYKLPNDQNLCNTRYDITFPSGNNGEWHEIPEGATDIQIWARAEAGKDIMFQGFATPPILCYKFWGTTFNPGFDNNYCGLKNPPPAAYGPEDPRCEGGCFPSDAEVFTPSGKAKISEIKVGDQVANAVAENGTMLYDTVYFLGHDDGDAYSFFYRIEMETLKKALYSEDDPVTTFVEMTPLHFVPVLEASEVEKGRIQWVNKRAKDIFIGDIVLALSQATDDPRRLVPHVVKGSSLVQKRGLFNPYTMSGRILVNNVSVSTHSEWILDPLFDAMGLTSWLPNVYQQLLLPLRVLFRLLGKEQYTKISIASFLTSVVTSGNHIESVGGMNAFTLEVAVSLSILLTVYFLQKKGKKGCHKEQQNH